MALNSPSKGCLIQTVEVNGLEHFRPAYDGTKGQLNRGAELLLIADPNNSYDANAVRVAYRDHQGSRQIGWVPKACNHNIAALLRLDKGLRAYVSRHQRARADLEIEVYAPSQSPDSRRLGETLGMISAIFCAGGYLKGMAELAAVPVGTVLACDSNSGRSSIDVIVKCVRVAWFRKSELGRGDVDTLAERGELVAQVVQQNPTTLCLYRKGEAPNGVPVVTGNLIVTNPENIILNNKKENAMNFSTTNLIKSNTDAATQAGYLEAGRIANNKVVQLSSKALPMMLRGYADTPIGKLVAANLAVIAAQQLRPQDATLAKLTTAMQVAAYGEVIATVDIEGWLDELLNSPEIKRAVSKMSDEPKTTDTDKFTVGAGSNRPTGSGFTEIV